MCIYCGTKKYRKIYENHFGPIPKDEDGRTYEIHHKDGDRTNNGPSNLKCVSLQEHYDIHYAQGDWMACHEIGQKLKLTGAEISKLAQKHAQEQVENGTHPWLKKEDGSSVGRDTAARVMLDGSHLFLCGEWKRENNLRLVEEGRHNFLGPKNNLMMLANGTHPSQNEDHRNYMSKIQKIHNRKLVENGTHTFQKLNSYVWECSKCGTSGKNKANYDRHLAGKRCKFLQKNNKWIIWDK